jgi:hypothetical protein
MIKVVRLVKRNPEMTNDEFRQYWMTKHAKIEREIGEISPIRKIQVSFALTQYVNTDGSRTLGEESEPSFDAILELYFDRIDDLFYEFNDTDIPNRIVTDELNFVDHSGGLVRVITEEEVIYG